LLRWWSEELLGMIPARVRERLGREDQRVFVAFSADDARVSRCGKGRVETVGVAKKGPDGRWPPSAPLPPGLDPASAEVVVGLPEAQTLRVVLELPIEAEEDLREALSYEVDRQTPFKVHEVYYDFQVIERLAAQRRLRVALTVVPRGALDQAVDAVGAWGLRPMGVSVGQAEQLVDPAAPALNLLPPEGRSRPRGAWGLLNRALAVAAVLLLVAVIAVPLQRQGTLIRELEGQVAALRTDADATLALRRELERLDLATRLVVERIQQVPHAIDILNELSIILPDDAWLQHLQMQPGRVFLQGQSDAASELVGLLDASAMFRNPTFSSPVVRDARSGKERFQIAAEVLVEAAQ
jgi:general secretion pathway protein L